MKIKTILTNKYVLILLCGAALSAAFNNCSGTDTKVVKVSADEQINEAAASLYIDSVAGSDTNDGTSSLSPWKSLSKISNIRFPMGTLIFLKRGSMWREQLNIVSSGMTIDAYGSGALPRIHGAKNLPVTAWTSAGPGLYQQTVTLTGDQALGNLSEDNVMLSPLPWKTNVATTFLGAATQTYSFDPTTKTVYIKPSTAPAGHTYSASVQLYGIYADGVKDLVIQNVHVARFSLHGIQLLNCTHCTVRNSSISAGGGAVIGPNTLGTSDYLYAGNGIEFGNSSTQGLVENVKIQQIFDSGISPQTYASAQILSQMTFQNSTIEECGFAGVEISVLSNGGSTGSQISDIKMNGLTIDQTGLGWSGRRYGSEGHGVRIKADAGAGTISKIVLQQSKIQASMGEGVLLAGELGQVQLHRLMLAGNHTGVTLADVSATTLGLEISSSLIYANGHYGIYYNAPAAAGFSILQNTFYSNGIDVAVMNQTGQAVLMNNIFASPAPLTSLYAQAPLVGPQVDSNCYVNSAHMIGYNGVVYTNLASFHTATGFETLGNGSNSVKLKKPMSGDFSLQATSPCKGLGNTVFPVEHDYKGANFATPPSSGALEF